MESNKDEMRRQYLDAKAQYDSEPSAYAHNRLFRTLLPYLKESVEQLNLNNFQRTFLQLEHLGYTGNDKYANQIVWPMVSLLSKLRSSNVAPDKFMTVFEALKKLNYLKPSQEHSLVLKFFLKRSDHYNLFDEFTQWWNVDNLRPDDFQPETWKEITYPALAETLYSQTARQYLRRLADGGNNNEALADQISTFIIHLREIFGKYPHFKFLPYYIAKLQLALGRSKEAGETFLPFARKNTFHFWVWDFLGELFKEYTEKHIVLLCRAALCKAEEEKLSGIFTKLIAAFEAQKMYGEAHAQLLKVVEIRKKNNWKIPPGLAAKLQNPIITSAAPVQSLLPTYKKLAKEADAVLFQNTITKAAVITGFLPDRKTIFFVTEKPETGKCKKNIAFLKNPKPGMLVDIVFDNATPVKVTLSEVSEIPSLVKTVSGKLIIVGDGKFGLVKDVFIPPALLEESKWPAGEMVTAKAFRSFNKKKNQWGWMAYHLEQQMVSG